MSERRFGDVQVCVFFDMGTYMQFRLGIMGFIMPRSVCWPSFVDGVVDMMKSLCDCHLTRFPPPSPLPLSPFKSILLKMTSSVCFESMTFFVLGKVGWEHCHLQLNRDHCWFVEG